MVWESPQSGLESPVVVVAVEGGGGGVGTTFFSNLGPTTLVVQPWPEVLLDPALSFPPFTWTGGESESGVSA